MHTITYGHWDITQVGPFNPTDYVGFIYEVTNTKSGKKYIGKKNLFTNRKTLVKKKLSAGKKTKRVIKESNWREYTTSSTHINSEILGGEQFKFKILSLHPTAGMLAYTEVSELVKNQALLAKFSDGTRAYYNGCIPGIRFIPSDK
jgi:hypothetical protein